MGKIERRQKSLKSECVRPTTPLSLGDAQRVGRKFVEIYNMQRLHSTIGHIAPQDKLEGREELIFAERKRKLAEARARLRQSAHSEKLPGHLPDDPEMGAAWSAQCLNQGRISSSR